jgi:hypothetical protein
LRKKKQAAESDVADEIAARLEFLKRNPEFLADIRVYNDLPYGSRKDIAARQREAERVSEKWRLPFILPITGPVDLARVWTPTPVRVVTMNGPSLGEQLRAKRDGRLFTPDQLEGRFVNLEIYTRASIVDLVPLIEKTLRDIYRAKDVKRRRRRPAEAAFQLKVYDLVVGGTKFSAISRKLRRPLTTVKSSFVIATEKIFGAQQKSREVRLAGFTPEDHLATCEICRKANTDKEMCSQARFYVDQDRVSQNYKTGFDTTGELRRTEKD